MSTGEKSERGIRQSGDKNALTVKFGTTARCITSANIGETGKETWMVTREDLEKIRDLTAEVRKKEARKLRLETAVTGSGVKLAEKVQSSPDKTQEAMMVSLVDLNAEIEQAKAEIRRLSRIIGDWADTLQPEERRLIRLRYCRCLSWEEVAECLAYSEQTVYRLHGSILRKLDL